MDRFSKVFHQVIRRKILYVHTHKDFHLTCNMLLHYRVKFKNTKNNRMFTLSVTTCVTKICCEILCNLPQKYYTNDFN